MIEVDDRVLSVSMIYNPLLCISGEVRGIETSN